MSRVDIEEALLARGRQQEALMREARHVRDEQFGSTVVLRGVIEITNVCRVNCDYCPMRRDNNRSNSRYFMTSQEILLRAREVRNAGIDVILLQGGETTRSLPAVEEAIPAIRELYGGEVEILLNLGNMSRAQYAKLRELGATSYILKHETSDPEVHRTVRHEDLDQRLRCMSDLQELGFRTGTGLISDLPGQSLKSIVDDILLAGRLRVDMCSVSPFVPAPDTPLSLMPPGSIDLALNIIAVLRICYPKLLIPSVSALEKTDQGGQSRGLEAGANVLTVNFTGDADRGRYLIYGNKRYIVRLDHVKEIVSQAGMTLRGSVFLAP